MKKESDFQKALIRKIKRLFPDCIILKNDAGYMDSIPDLSIFYKTKYAFLEVKRSLSAYRHSLKNQPNQFYYIQKIKKWGAYASYVFPENVDQVLRELKEAFT